MVEMSSATRIYRREKHGQYSENNDEGLNSDRDQQFRMKDTRSIDRESFNGIRCMPNSGIK